MENYTVAHHNDFNQLSLVPFTKSEQNILITILWNCKNKNTNTLTLEKNELKKLAGITRTNDAEFVQIIDNITDKLLNIPFKTTGSGYIFNKFLLFSSLKLTDEYELIVKVNEEFEYLLNEFDQGNFTKYELTEYVNLKSVYSKELYKRLMQYKSNGWYYVTLKEFNEIFQVPKSYSQPMINQRILNKAVNEIKNLPNFKNLKIELTRSKRKGRPITHYNFTWKKFDLVNSTIKSKTTEINYDQFNDQKIESPTSEPIVTPVTKFGHSFEEKQEIVKSYQANKRGWKTVAKKWNIDNATIKEYVKEVQEQESQDLPFN